MSNRPIQYYVVLHIKTALQLMLVLYIVLITTYRVNAQNNHASNKTQKVERILQQPKIPAPEKELLFFLQEDFIDVNNFNANVVSVYKDYKAYDPEGRVLESDTITRKPIVQKSNILKHLPYKTVIDKIGIDSIAKRDKHTYELYDIDEESSYLNTVYLYKKGNITGVYDNSSTVIYSNTYSYDDKEKLIKIKYTDDYEHTNEVVKISYNTKGQVAQIKTIDNSDGTAVDITKYSYKNDLLTQVQTISAHYFFNQTDLEGEVEDIEDFSVYETDDTFKTVATTSFIYNEQQQLQKAVIHRKGTSKTDDFNNFEETETYTLIYKSNQLIVNASLPEKRQHVFTFDTHQNPIQIDSYVTDNDKWLHKQTTLKITYQ